MEFTRWLKGRTAETVAYMAKNKINMFKEGIKLDKILDEQLNECSSNGYRGVLLQVCLLDF